MDENRYEDGISLRYRFEDGPAQKGPCTMLEMMIALSVRCEESIMYYPGSYNDVGELFWVMIDSLGLSYMTNGFFNEKKAGNIISRALNHRYDFNGKGGLFRIDKEFLTRMNKDMRKMEIWDQMGLYIIFEKENKK